MFDKFIASEDSCATGAIGPNTIPLRLAGVVPPRWIGSSQPLRLDQMCNGIGRSGRAAIRWSALSMRPKATSSELVRPVRKDCPTGVASRLSSDSSSRTPYVIAMRFIRQFGDPLATDTGVGACTTPGNPSSQKHRHGFYGGDCGLNTSRVRRANSSGSLESPVPILE